MGTSSLSIIVIFSGRDVRLHQLDLNDLHLVQTFKYRQKQDSNKLKIILTSLN